MEILYTFRTPQGNIVSYPDSLIESMTEEELIQLLKEEDEPIEEPSPEEIEKRLERGRKMLEEED